MAQRVVDELRPARILRGVDAALVQTQAELVRVTRPELVLLEGVEKLQAPPRRLQIRFVPTEADLRRPGRLPRDPLDELLDSLHLVAVIRIRLVPLDHRELGDVLVREALVAEVLA